MDDANVAFNVLIMSVSINFLDQYISKFICHSTLISITAKISLK